MQSNSKKIIIKKKVVSNDTEKSKLDFYKMDKSAIRNYSEQIATEKLCKQGYRFINISTGREKSLYRMTSNKENVLARFMFYRFNPNVKNNYAWILKENFNDKDYNYLIFVLYVVNSVHVLLIPSRDVISKFESRNYEDRKSPPEWGIRLNYQVINHLITHYEIT